MAEETIRAVPVEPDRVALRRRSVMAIGAGNLLEWYDFAVYASVATMLGKLFFPAADPLASLLATFSVFAVGYLARPVGAAVFGRLADSRGRRYTLIIVITLMGVSTLLIGLMPTYASVGVAAPVMLVLARLIQGLSVGGEFSASTSYLVEMAPPGKRGLYGSFAFLTANFGFAFGLAIVYAFNNALSADAMGSWGWRIPFLLSFPLLLIGMYLRARTTETPAFTALIAEGKVTESPFASTVRGQWRQMGRLIGLGISNSTISYTALAFVLSFLLVVQEQPPQQVYPSVLLSITVGSLFVPVFGALSDRVGRRPVLLAACVAVIVFAFPGYLLMTASGFAAMTAGQLLLWVPVAMFCGVLPSTFSELFPTRLRSTGVGVPYAIAAAVFSGTTPLVSTAAIGWTDSSIAPAGYLVITALISIAFAWGLRETARTALRDS